jgi:intracellular septation protein
MVDVLRATGQRSAMTDPSHRQLNPVLKLALELGPLVIFFLGNQRAGLFTATAAFMIATALALTIHYLLVKRLPIMPLVTGIVVLVFGGLTLLLHDELFIKLKPTIVNSLFGAALLGGLAFNKLLLPIVFESVIQLTEEGWRKLTLRWGIFFFVLALLNEVVWRTQSTDVWVNFKVFATMPITILFALAQTPLIMRYSVPEKGSGAKD